MKKVYILLTTALLISAVLQAQTTTTWVGPASGGNWSTGGNWSNGVPGTDDIVVFDNGVSGAINNVPSVRLTELRIEDGSTVTLNVNSGNDRTINIQGGGRTAPRLVIEAGSTLILEGDNNDELELRLTRSGGGGNLNRGDISGTLVLGQNGVLYLGNNNTTMVVSGAIENNDGTVSGSSSGRLSFTSTGVYRHQRNGGSIPTASWDDASLVEVTGITNSVPSLTSLQQEFGSFTWNCPNQTGLISFAGYLTDVDGDFSVQNTGSGQLTLKIGGGSATTTSVAGDFNLSGGYLYILENDNTQTLSVWGDVNITGGTLARGGGTANFVFDNNGAQTFTKTGGTISGSINFRIDNGAEVNFGTSVLNGNNANFTLDDDAKIIVSHPDGLSSNGSTGAIQVGNNITYSDQGIYEFRGARTGRFSTSGNDVQSLIIDNTSGEVLVQRPFDVTDDLVLTNGYATTNNTNIITLGTGAAASSSNGSYINGPLRKQFSNSSSFTFPVGKVAGAGIHELRIQTSGGSGTSTFTAEYLRGNPITVLTNGNVYGSGVARVSSCEYWQLERTSGSRGAVVTLSWNPNSNCAPTSYINNLTSLRVARHTGASWSDQGPASGATMGSTVLNGEITSNGTVSGFGFFALASSNLADNPLPVLFDGVRAFEKNGGVQIDWSNLTERDVIRYEVERSANGIDFFTINEQAPKSNRDDKASYTYFDASATAGANYYRVRVDEIGGKSVYSKILRVELGSVKKAGFQLYPNPVTGRQFSVTLSGLKQGRYQLQVFSTSGKQVYSQVVNNVGSGVTEMVQLPAQLPAGMYVTIITGDSYRESKQVILK